MQRPAIVMAMATVLTTLLGAQPAATVATHGPLAVTARLRSFAVEVTVPFAAPAALLVLQYDAERGWRPVRPLPAQGPQWHDDTSARVTLARRVGRINVPSGTEIDRPVDPGVGCGAQGGVYLPASGRCSIGGSESFSHVLNQPTLPRDYRVAVLQMPRRTRADIAAALGAIARSGAGRELEQVVMALGVAQGAGWAALVVPVGADHLPGMR